MDIGSLFLLLALTLLVGVYVARPFVTRQGFQVTQTDRELSALEAARDKVLAIIHELDMDHTMGKLEDDDYEAQRSTMVTKGAAILKEIDEVINASPAARKQRAAHKPETASNADAVLEAAVARLRKGTSEEGAGFCAKCGKALMPDDRFCNSCGEATTLETS